MPAVRPVALPFALALLLVGCQGMQPAADVRAATGEAAARLLATRSAAVLAGDRAGLASTLAVGADPAAVALGTRLTGLPITAWSYRVQSAEAGPAPGELRVQAILSYRLAADPPGLPAASALRRLVLTPDPARRGELLVRSDQPVGAWLPWDGGPVVWAGGAGAAVLDLRPGTAAGKAGDDAALLAGAARAATAVTSVWGTRWRRVPVLVATEGAAQLAHLTGREPGAVTGLVAVTTADRVYVDMAAWLALPAAGRQALLGHEVTHLATGAASDPAVPLWLEEGFADYVGLRGSGIPLRTVAEALLGPVAAGAQVPAALPSDADFVAGGTTAAKAYAGAWLACRLIASSGGPRTLVALYRATSAGRSGPAADVDAALREITGRGVAGWTARWQTYVTGAAAQARSGSLRVVA